MSTHSLVFRLTCPAVQANVHTLLEEIKLRDATLASAFCRVPKSCIVLLNLSIPSPQAESDVIYLFGKIMSTYYRRYFERQPPLLFFHGLEQSRCARGERICARVRVGGGDALSRCLGEMKEAFERVSGVSATVSESWYLPLMNVALPSDLLAEEGERHFGAQRADSVQLVNLRRLTHKGFYRVEAEVAV